MTSVKDALLGSKSFGRGVQTPLLDPKFGGQFGFANDYPGFLSNSPYVRRNLIVRVISAPRGFRDLGAEDSVIMTNALKALFELHAKRIEGLQGQVNVDTQSTPFGGAGEIQEVVVNTTRQASEPSFTWDEKYGRPINRFLEYWITELLMDPVSKYPNVVTRATSIKPTDLLPDYNTATAIFIEPDPTHRYVDKAWLCANMFPKNGGEKVGRKDQTAGGELLEYNVPFSAITQMGAGVDRLAQKLLDQMNLTGANPNLRQAFVDDITADIKASESGYAEKIAAAGRTAIQP